MSAVLFSIQCVHEPHDEINGRKPPQKDRVVLVETEDNLQTAIFQLTITLEAYNMKIPSKKTKTTAFKVKDTVRSKM